MEASGPMERTLATEVSRLWWIWLVAGIAWLTVAYVVLQFDDASAKTVGVLVGLMFLASGAQHLMIAMLSEQGRWFFAIFGGLFVMAGVIALANPEDTFAGIADIIGALFFIVGLFWLIRAFASRATNGLWGLDLLAGILMLILAFWASGQFYTEKAYTLLIFTGIWALMHGITDLVQAFQVRSLKDLPG